MKFHTYLIFFFFFVVSASCGKLELRPPQGIVVHEIADSITFVAFGDYGDNNENERQVADLVHNLNPDFIITTGDNNYPNGSVRTIVKNIGKYYGNYIYNYDAPSNQQCYGMAQFEGKNRFFPTLGNHDYTGIQGRIPYLNYFTLPGNEIYYDFIWGPVHFYALDSDIGHLEQKAWFEEKLAISTEVFNVVYFHHSPYSTGSHGNNSLMQWDYAGVDLVLSGHDHIYERHTPIDNSNPSYIVTGLGGRKKRECGVKPMTSNQFNSFCYDGDYGTLYITATDSMMKIQFLNTSQDLIDEFVLTP